MVSEEIDIIITKSFENQADPQELATLKSWLDQSDDNLRTYMTRKSIWDASLVLFTPEDINLDEEEFKMMDAISEAQKPKRARRLRYLVTRIAAAVIIVAVVMAAGIFLGYRLIHPPMAVQCIRSLYGSVLESQLPDGSKVWLNANSSISFCSDFTANRVVDLSGEAFFEVSADRRHPFVVNTADGRLTATGTKFNINAYPEMPYAQFTLVKGSAEVSVPAPDDERNHQKTYSLSVGQQLTCRVPSDSVALAYVNTYNICAWRQGELIFRDQPLSAIFTRLEQIYNVKFIIDDPDIVKGNYNAKFRGENLSQIIHILEMSSPISCEFTNPDNAFATDPAKARRTVKVTGR